jgi:DNA replication protein DnaC
MCWRVPRLIEELRIAHGDGSYIKFLKTIAMASLIVLDDWGLTAFSTQDRADLLEILDDRVNAGSTLTASQLPVDTWHAYLCKHPNYFFEDPGPGKGFEHAKLPNCDD